MPTIAPVPVHAPPAPQMAALALIQPRPDQPRTRFDEGEQQKLTTSIRRLGILTPLLVRRTTDGHYTLIGGERRFRSAKALGLTDVPVRILDLADDRIAEASVVENTHRLNLDAMDEANALHQLLVAAPNRTEDELAAIMGMSRKAVREKLSLRRLVPQVANLVTTGVLPLDYALLIARAPTERQDQALDMAFLPLVGKDERFQRSYLRPRRELEDWLRDHIRLNPKSEDAAVFLPELAEQVRTAETERRATVLALSTLRHHIDKSEPQPILAQSWRRAEGKERCRLAQPGVIVLGDGQGTLIHVCIAKKDCPKHWPRKRSTTEQRRVGVEVRKAAADAQRQQERQRQADEQWRTAVRPRLFAQLARQLDGMGWTQPLFYGVLDAITHDKSTLTHYVGPLTKVKKARYVGVLALAMLLRHSWQQEQVLVSAKRLSIKIPALPASPQAPAPSQPRK